MLKFIEFMHVDTKREQFKLMLINKYYVYNKDVKAKILNC